MPINETIGFLVESRLLNSNPEKGGWLGTASPPGIFSGPQRAPKHLLCRMLEPLRARHLGTRRARGRAWCHLQILPDRILCDKELSRIVAGVHHSGLEPLAHPSMKMRVGIENHPQFREDQIMAKTSTSPTPCRMFPCSSAQCRIHQFMHAETERERGREGERGREREREGERERERERERGRERERERERESLRSAFDPQKA